MLEARKVGASAVLVLACLFLGACGRFGVHLVQVSGGDPMAHDASADADLPDADTSYARDSGPGADGGKDCDAASCEPPVCAAPSSMQSLCGCGVDSTGDSDGDGVPDCSDFCPGAPDQRDDGACACPAAEGDIDGDGVANCKDRCPRDAVKVAPGACGCGVPDRDGDGDGTSDCVDDCPTDPDKTQPGECGCGQSDQDTDLDGTPDCHDSCKGTGDEGYVVDSSCGTGYCRAHNQPSACVAGKESACTPAAPLTQSDATCDGIDDDCDGKVDENFAALDTTCGVGVCASTGRLSCNGGVASDSCKPGGMSSANDATCDGRDDDCDGKTDENFPVSATTCSTGACAANGSIACVMGMMVDSCMATTPTAATDTTCNNTDDDCDGRVDEEFMSSATNCGVGVCARTGSLTCVNGATLNSCKAGSATNANDTTCDKLDGDCDGRVDEGYVATATSCGTGACASTGTLTCVNGAQKNSCVAKTPVTTIDDATVPGNGIDDDCDGKVDENVPACDTTAKTYEAGVYTNIAIPGNCHSVKVELWGGGGGGGQNEGSAAGGSGGPGGYATATVLVATPLNLYVGAAAKNDCSSAGTNASSASYDGGSGGSGTGSNGADGAVSGGGTGGQPSTGSRGGDGFYGGGGGGQGQGGLGNSGNGGGGGAASVLVVNGTVAAAAGGGGGGGGAQSITILGTISAEGGAGGSGCRGNGQVATSNGGGGGGGGMCKGSSMSGSGTTPANSGKIPSGRAKGGASSCGAGGAGYAILTFSP